MSERVRITDVSARDGLQNEPGVIPTGEKVRLVELLSASGVDEVELTSFVSPKWVPQLADCAEVLKGAAGIRASLGGRPGCEFSVLIPNLKGFEAYQRAEAGAVAVGTGGPVVGKLSVFTAASETFSQRNTNTTIAGTIDRFREILGHPRSGQTVRGYVSCAIECPFEGPIDAGRVIDVASELRGIGVDEIDLGDTIGAATPGSIERLLRVAGDRFGDWMTGAANFTLHLHDTFGRAPECVKVALGMGVRSFDGAAAGLGGCPYASTPGRRAPGNLSTELLVATVHGAGYRTGVDAAKLAAAAEFAGRIVRSAAAGMEER